jgi:protein-S-isoprenylcysteine O-methyltransferase Ste14
MEGAPLASMLVRLLVGMTGVLQVALLVAWPIPSPVASLRMRPHRVDATVWGTNPASGPDRAADLLLPLGALGGMLLSLIAVAWPTLGLYLLPPGAGFPIWLVPVSGVCLVLGNGLVLAAVAALRRQTRFDSQGQSRKLVTGGIFAWLQHPIVTGMGLIYLGLFLVCPSPMVFCGLVCFGCHQKRRTAQEEMLLATRFGRSYQAYRARTGRFWPRWPPRPRA